METDQEDRQDNVWVIEQLGNLIYDQPTGYVWLDINYHPKNITSWSALYKQSTIGNTQFINQYSVYKAINLYPTNINV